MESKTTTSLDLIADNQLSFDTGRDEIGYYRMDNQWENINYDRIYNDFFPAYYPNYVYTEDKVSKSFKIVQKLIELKVVNEIDVKRFVELVNEISKVL